MTLKNILQEEKFSGLKLINSKADLNRPIATVESTETPDIAAYLAPNSFLLTTGMVYKDDQKGLIKLIEELNRLPIAGLGIKLGRFIDRIDDEVIKKADELAFPLIQIPMDMTLGSIFHCLLSHLWNNQNEELLYSLNIQRKFSNLLIKNTPLEALIRSLSHTLKEPIALVDPFGNVTQSSSDIKSKYSKRFIRELVESYSQLEDKKNSVFINPQEDGDLTSMASIFPIKMAGYYTYYLIVFNAENLKFPLSAMAIEQAIMILAFTLYKNIRIRYSTLSGREDFFKDLIHGKSQEKLSENQLIFKGKKYGFRPSRFYKVVLAKMDYKDELRKEAILEESYTLVFSWLKDKLERDLDGALVFPDRESYEYIILLQSPISDLEKKLSGYRKILKKTLQLGINYYVGHRVQGIGFIQYSYKEAREAIKYGEVREGLDYIRYSSQMGVQDLMQLLPKHQVESFVNNNLKSLAYPEDELARHLRDTLKTYLDLNCNITETAKAKFIHRNTVKYRIERCNEILGLDVSDSSNSLPLRLSLAYTSRDP